VAVAEKDHWTGSAVASEQQPDTMGSLATRADSGRGRHAARPLPWHRRLIGTVVDRVPAGAQGLTSTHVMVLALVGLGAVAMAIWWLAGARPQHVADTATIDQPSAAIEPSAQPGSEPASPSSQLSAQSGAAASASAAPQLPAGAAPSGLPAAAPDTPAADTEVVVDVAGKVRRPGIVVLPAGARVADALEAAGGARTGVDTAGLNLARPLLDGEQVLVGLPPLGAAPDASSAAESGTASAPVPDGATALVDLNTATLEQLDTLPGIGPVTGQAIVDWRTEHGAFTSVDELLEVDGIGDATLADLRDLVTV
jgi:competence protein ComEA